MTDDEARVEIRKALESASDLRTLRRGIYIASGRGRAGPMANRAYRFAHYGQDHGLDDELKQWFVLSLRRIASPHALELAKRLEE